MMPHHDTLEIEPQGDHEYVARLSAGGVDAGSWISVTPDVLDELGVSAADEEDLVRRTVAFVADHQSLADFPPIIALEDVLAAYEDYADAIAPRGGAPG